MLGPAEIFTIFFVTLGPLKVLGPFAQRTHGLDDANVRRIALTSFVFGTIGIVVGGFVGRSLLVNWDISIGSMTVAAGIVFLLVALRQLLEQYEPAHATESPAQLPASPTGAALRILFPIVLTPYGIAAVIVLLASSSASLRTELIVALLVAVMSHSRTRKRMRDGRASSCRPRPSGNSLRAAVLPAPNTPGVAK